MLGIQLPVIEKPEEVDFEVYKSNMRAINAFLMLDGCAWQYTGMGELIGLDYSAADVIWNRTGVKLTPGTFRGVMLFSRTVATELNKKKEK